MYDDSEEDSFDEECAEDPPAEGEGTEGPTTVEQKVDHGADTDFVEDLHQGKPSTHQITTYSCSTDAPPTQNEPLKHGNYETGSPVSVISAFDLYYALVLMFHRYVDLYEDPSKHLSPITYLN